MATTHSDNQQRETERSNLDIPVKSEIETVNILKKKKCSEEPMDLKCKFVVSFLYFS